MVEVAAIGRDDSEFPIEYQPGNEAANEAGYVKMPNVNVLIEMADMREANRSYQANLQVIKQARELISHDHRPDEEPVMIPALGPHRRKARRRASAKASARCSATPRSLRSAARPSPA